MDQFMGIPFDHDGVDVGNRGSVPQLGMVEFQAMVKPILDAGVAIRWHQYTPFFSDGEVCEFGIGEVRFRPSGDEFDEEGGDYEDGFFDLYDDQLRGGEEEVYRGQVQDGYEYGYGERRFAKFKAVYEKTGRVFPKHPLFDAMDALNFSPFEELLYKTFGDHAEITMTSEKVIKEHYSHE